MADPYEDSFYDNLDVSLSTLERYEELDRLRKSYESEAKEIATYVFPRRSIFEDTNGEYRRVGEKLHDGTAVQANNTLANGLMGHLVTEGNPWFKLGLPWIDAMDIPGVGEWLDIVEKVIYDDFSRSNFYEQCQEIFADVGALGNACLYSQEGRDMRPWYLAVHPYEFYFDVDERNQVDTVYRRYWKTVRQLILEFGIDGVDRKVLNKAKEGNLNDRIEVVHACEPRKLRIVGNPSSKNKAWKSEYWDRTNQHLMRESGYDHFPYVGLRWATNSGEIYGRGPGGDALVAIKRANLINSDVLTASQKALFPTALVPESMRNRFTDNPKGRIYMKASDPEPKYLEPSGNYPIGLDREQDVRQIIKEAFMVDMFLMLNQINFRSKAITATQVMEMQSERAAVLGTAVGRIANELLDPVIDQEFYRARKAMRIPPPPVALIQWMQSNRIDAGHLKVDYIGPLAQALKRFHATQGLTRGLNAVLPYSEIWPDIPDNFNSDEVARIIAESHGMPARVIYDKKIVDAKRQARAAAQQQAAQVQQQMVGADVANKMAKGPEPGSPLEAVMQRASGQGEEQQQ